jgi:hypothetical protein
VWRRNPLQSPRPSRHLRSRQSRRQLRPTRQSFFPSARYGRNSLPRHLSRRRRSVCPESSKNATPAGVPFSRQVSRFLPICEDDQHIGAVRGHNYSALIDQRFIERSTVFLPKRVVAGIGRIDQADDNRRIGGDGRAPVRGYRNGGYWVDRLRGLGLGRAQSRNQMSRPRYWPF